MIKLNNFHFKMTKGPLNYDNKGTHLVYYLQKKYNNLLIYIDAIVLNGLYIGLKNIRIKNMIKVLDK